MDILKISQVCDIDNVLSFDPLKLSLRAPKDFSGPAQPSLCLPSSLPVRPSTPFQLSPELSVPVQNILLLCLFAAIPLALSLFAADGIPGISCGPGPGAFVIDPATSPHLCLERSAPL